MQFNINYVASSANYERVIPITLCMVKKGNSYMAQEPQRRINYQCLSCQLSTTRSNVYEVPQWATSNCSQRQQPATDNGVKDGRFD